MEPPGDLDSKREDEIGQAERHRRRRDELNDKTREWMEKRDALNGQVRALVEEAVKHREARDKLNNEVREAKAERDRLNRRVNEVGDALNDLRRQRQPRTSVPVGKLRRDLKELEFRQMTSVLTPAKERALIEEMQAIRAQLDKIEKALENDVEVKKQRELLHATKEEAEAAHRHVGELAEKAQAEHDAMTKLYEESDGLRREADKAQEEFIRTKMLADEEHRKHIEHVRQVHDLDKLAHGYTSRLRQGGEAAEEPHETRREAEQIFERFKKGEKLSTEDLMTLQKSGYL
jgi:uncharacterized coiled-coil DUF342 family protein